MEETIDILTWADNCLAGNNKLVTSLYLLDVK